MICVNCGKEISGENLFCPECGVRLNQESASGQMKSEKSVCFCGNCGQQIPINSSFCPVCSAPQGDFAQGNTGNPFSQKKSGGSKQKIILASAAGGILALCLIIIAAAAILIKPTIDLNSYLTVTFEGYDTIGNASVELDIESFEKDYENKLGKERKEQSFLYQLMELEGEEQSSACEVFLSSCVNYTVDQTDGLTNGDVITVTWDCDDACALEQYGYKLQYENVQFTVAGLEEAATFDPFDGIDVIFEGVSPDGYAWISANPTNNAAQYLSYELDAFRELKNGDTVTVSVSTVYGENPVEFCIANYGEIPSPLQKEYTVSGLSSYIASPDEITSESMEIMKANAIDIYQEDVDENWGSGEKLKNITCLGSYFLTPENKEEYYGYQNALYLVYRVKVKNKYSYEEETYSQSNYIYWYLVYYDLITDSAGETEADLSVYDTPYETVVIDSGIYDGWTGTKQWYYSGYETLDDLYNAVVSDSDGYLIEGNCEEIQDGTQQEAALTEEDGIIFPDSSQKLLSENEIQELSDEELRYAINEIYARNGYIFQDETLKAYYEKYDWYDGTVKSEDFTINLLNDVEVQNIDMLQKERDSRS